MTDERVIASLPQADEAIPRFDNRDYHAVPISSELLVMTKMEVIAGFATNPPEVRRGKWQLIQIYLITSPGFLSSLVEEYSKIH